MPDEVLEVVLAPLAEPLPPRLSPFSLFEWDEISFFRLARVSKQWQRVVDQRADPWAHSLGWKRVIIHRVRRPVDRRRHAPVINGPGTVVFGPPGKGPVRAQHEAAQTALDVSDLALACFGVCFIYSFILRSQDENKLVDA